MAASLSSHLRCRFVRWRRWWGLMGCLSLLPAADHWQQRPDVFGMPGQRDHVEIHAPDKGVPDPVRYTDNFGQFYGPFAAFAKTYPGQQGFSDDELFALCYNIAGGRAGGEGTPVIEPLVGRAHCVVRSDAAKGDLVAGEARALAQSEEFVRWRKRWRWTDCPSDPPKTTFYTRIVMRGDYLNAGNCDNSNWRIGTARAMAKYQGEIYAEPHDGDEAGNSPCRRSMRGDWNVENDENAGLLQMSLGGSWSQHEGFKVGAEAKYTMAFNGDNWKAANWDRYLIMGRCMNLENGRPVKLALVDINLNAEALAETREYARYAEARASIRPVTFQMSRRPQ